jgi:hypothetical protein
MSETMKVLFGMALRQATGFVESLLQLVGLDWTVPDLSTLSRCQKTLAVRIPYSGQHLGINPVSLCYAPGCFREPPRLPWIDLRIGQSTARQHTLKVAMIGTRRFENDQHAAVGNPPEESSQSFRKSPAKTGDETRPE